MSLEYPCGMCGKAYDYNCDSCPDCSFNKCNWCCHSWNNSDNPNDKHEKDCHWYNIQDDFNAWV